MTIDVVAMVSDGSLVDLQIYDNLDLMVLDIPSGRVVVLVGSFVRNDSQYPVGFAKSWADGHGALKAIHEAVLTRQRCVDMRKVFFTPTPEAMVEIKKAMGCGPSGEDLDEEACRSGSTDPTRNPKPREVVAQPVKTA